MNQHLTHGCQVEQPQSHHSMTSRQTYIFFPEHLAHWETGVGPVRIGGDTGGGEFHELIEKVIANRPRRHRAYDAATGKERPPESPIPFGRTVCYRHSTDALADSRSRGRSARRVWFGDVGWPEPSQ